MIKAKKQMFLVVGAFALVMLLGTVTYAFFNYTRTGGANVVQTGRIYFNTNQTDTIYLTNAFPITRTLAATDTTNTDDVVITITGDTTYDNGIEYLVTATNVSNTIGSGANEKTIPISIIATASNLGTSDEDYFDNRGTSAQTSIYKVLANETISNDDQLLVGYIKSGATGINGSITIRAYLDSDLIAITDTYNGTDTVTDNMGTTSEWVDERTVITTTEWNSLNSDGVSFKVKVEANEGTWVTNPNAPTVVYTAASCFTYEENNDEITITGYDYETCGTDVSIPPTINNKSVTTIGDDAFYNGDYSSNNHLTSVIIPNGVTTIGYEAFGLCNITNVVIPSSVTSISSNAFRGNPLSEITFNTNSLVWDETTIDYVLGPAEDYEGESLKIIINNATIIPDECFSYFFNGYIPLEIEINSNVTSIGEGAFYQSGLTSITLPNSVTTIGDYAFQNNSLTSIVLPNSVTTIGNSAFGDNSLTSITLPNSVTTIGDYAFQNNSLTSIVLPNSVTTIGNSAFGDNSLTSITLPNSVTTIGDYAFGDIDTIRFENKTCSVIEAMDNYYWYAIHIYGNNVECNNE